MTSADFPDNSLKEFMQLVSAQHNIKVVIDQKGLQSIGLTENAKISINDMGKPLKEIINKILKSLHDDLKYEIKDGELWITVKDKKP